VQPLYQQIKNEISARITQNEWPAGQKLPSENELVRSLNISRMTIHRALRELAHEGLVNRVHGVGTFVAEKQKHASLLELQDIAEEIQLSGRVHSTRKLLLKTEKASSDVASKMELDKITTVFHLKTVHSQDGIPVQLEDRYVNPALVPDFMSVDLTETTATRYLMELFKPDEMEHVVQAILPHKKIARILRMEPTNPCLQLTRRTWKDDRVVTLVTMIYPGNRYDLGARYATDNYQTR